MKNFLLYPFKIALQEIEINKQIKEELSQSDLKIKAMPGFIPMNYMFFIIYVILYLAILYLIVGAFITHWTVPCDCMGGLNL